ncbi:MAG TPA: zinc metalloprotease HtpX [Candidatus Omnitrophota bacterium]|nr:zinc metalloprotease HtpX [Candidatus Omnitrophota bacterium]
MPYSFTQIEEDKTRTIGFVFSFLILFYFLAFWGIAMVVANAIAYSEIPTYEQQSFVFFFLDFPTTLIILAIACVVGYGHWSYTTSNLIKKMLGVLGAEKLNEKDTYHQMFRNILDEVSVATGGVKIEGVIIPTMAMNAFALSDFEGHHVLGTTEGVLARLSRAQIEAIVGHEVAHIVSRDCLATTVTSSIFALYGGLLKGIELMLRGSGRRSSYSSRGRGSGGGAVAVILLIYILLLLTKFLSHLVRMFISRQREYRADAISVRLTRDPLSLAEALYAIAYHWRGQELTAQEMEAIFIVNPQYAYLDEHEGIFAELFSTHPPVEKRLGILLEMAHADVEQLVQGVKKLENKPRTQVPEAVGIDTKWMVHKDGRWQGPFELVQMATFDWIEPQTWIKRLDEDKVKPAYEDQALAGVLGHSDEMKEASEKCPRCHLALSKVYYEGVELEKCPFCHGVLVHENDVKRIIIRQDVGFSEKVKHIAETIKKTADMFMAPAIKRNPQTLFTCPKCNHPRNKMHRMFYTEVYKVEMDRCFACGSIWFDHDELEVLQYLIEEATTRA